MLKRNEGTLDRIVRLALGVVLLPAGLFWPGALQFNVFGLLAVALGVIGLVTALTGVCPTYNLFGFSTLETDKKQSIASTGV